MNPTSSARVCAAFLLMQTCACGDDAGSDDADDEVIDSGERTDDDAGSHDAGGADAKTAVNAAAADAARLNDGGSQGGDGGSGASLQSIAPTCASGNVASINIQGAIGSLAVDYTQPAVSTVIRRGEFATVDSEGGMALNYVLLQWAEGGLQAGEEHALTGSYLALPDSSTSNAGPHCVREGRIVAADPQPQQGSLLYFEVTKVQKRSSRIAGGTCDGPQLDAKLVACVYRTNAVLPTNP